MSGRKSMLTGSITAIVPLSCALPVAETRQSAEIGSGPTLTEDWIDLRDMPGPDVQIAIPENEPVDLAVQVNPPRGNGGWLFVNLPPHHQSEKDHPRRQRPFRAVIYSEKLAKRLQRDALGPRSQTKC